MASNQEIGVLERELIELSQQHYQAKKKLREVEIKERSITRSDRNLKRQREHSSASKESASKKRLTSSISENPVTENKVDSSITKRAPANNLNQPELKQRNRRLFNNVLLGTLNQFKKESQQQTAAEKRRAEIDIKVTEKVEKESKELLEKQTEDLLKARESAQEQKDSIEKLQEEKHTQILEIKWANHKKLLQNFKATKTKPSILYSVNPRERKKGEEKEIQKEEQEEEEIKKEDQEEEEEKEIKKEDEEEEEAQSTTKE